MLKIKKTFFSILLILITIFSFSLDSISASSSISIPFVFLSEYSANMDVGSEFYIIAITSTGNIPTWKSNNSKVASVNTYGRVTAKKSGAAVITAKIKGAEASCRITINKTKITISKDNVTLERGQILKLSATTSTNSKVTWKSSKKSIATIDESGVITAVKPGEANIIASADGNNSICKIKVNSPTIKLSKTNISLYRGQAEKLSADISSGINPIWKTNKKSIATVDSTGKVTAIKHGYATITATVDGVAKSCTVTVKQPNISLSSKELKLKKGSSTSITATVSSGLTPVWSSSNSNVVNVDTNGKLTAIKKGTAYIRAAEDGVKVQCIVHVTE